MSLINRLKIDIRFRIISLLVLIWIVAIFREKNWSSLYSPLFSIFSFAILDMGYTYLITKKRYYPFSSLVSGILIALIISPISSMPVLFLAVIFGFLSKQFLKVNGRNIFNPAAFGIVVSSLLFQTPISWWSVAPGGWIFLIILFSSLTIYKLKRLQFPIIYL